MRSPRSLFGPLLLFVASFVIVIGLQHVMIDRWRHTHQRFRDTLYLPSSQYVRVISLGYNQFTADFLWLRMIQVFAAAWSAAENPTQIKNYCDVITDLAPRFTDPYNFAIMGIGEEGRSHARNAEIKREPLDPFGDPYLKPATIDKYIEEIVQKALVRNPGNHVVPYAGAFHAYYTLDNLPLAKYYIRMAKYDPNYPEYLNSWEGHFDVKQGRYIAAFEKFMGDYITAVRKNNKDYFGITQNHLNRALNAWLIDEIKNKALEFEKKNGRLPSVKELNDSGAFKGFEYPVNAAVAEVLARVHEDERVLGLIEADVNAFTKQVTRKWDALPPGPYDTPDNPFPGFTIWSAMKDDPDRFVLPTAEAIAWVKRFITLVAQDALAEREKTGKIPDYKYFESSLGATDPFGDPWIYDPSTGALKCKSLPNIAEIKLPQHFEKD